MALDQIWKQQLTLVTYGNEFLAQDLSFQRWVKHAIFDQHAFAFRDLLSQHLLAQHFQIWLEGLKRQGVQRISLHNSSILNEEQNPNSNVELLPYAHFIVSHEANKKQAWIFGKELAEWYKADNDYEAPAGQQLNLRLETLWRFELNSKLSKRIEADLQQPNWDDIQIYTDNELFDSKFAAGFEEPEDIGMPYYGKAPDASSLDLPQQSLLPTDYAADYAHKTFYRLDALSSFIQAKIQHPYNAEGEVLSPEEQLNIRHFSQKIDELSAKFIVKAANHYKTARLSAAIAPSPLDNDAPAQQAANKAYSKPSADSNSKTGVFALIMVTIVICICAYYFGL
ncbi:hypothetical protein [Acinetobacter tianfuensis]|uniref:Uncharacterized protein n=1 Tax=Acinetobacter tianfuensis TaxID=2419603 RepID=A0A3A8EXU9_9GAMM|nr:hypothetical protein [Acinetobacter tianfuensis]RKG33283.1 hypothetical protein D7V32_03945 [Acinetobacter tianfuensis]